MGPSAFSSLGTWGGYRQCLEALLDDENTDVVMLVTPAGPNKDPSFPSFVSQAMEAHPDKGVVVWVYSVDTGEEMANRYMNTGKVVAYRTLDRAMKALSRVAAYWEHRNRDDGP